MITTETVNRIVVFRGNGLPVVSLYVRVPTDPSSRGAMVRRQVDGQLHEIRPMGEDHVSLPRGVRDQVVVDETPWVRSMMAVLDEYHRRCVAVVDRETARTWELYQDEMRETGTLQLSADLGRNDNKAEELTKRHFRQVVTMLDQLYRNEGFELLAVGGHRPELPRFLDFLSHDLRGRVAGIFSVDDDARFALGGSSNRPARSSTVTSAPRSAWSPTLSRRRPPAAWPRSVYSRACGQARLGRIIGCPWSNR